MKGDDMTPAQRAEVIAIIITALIALANVFGIDIPVVPTV